MKSITSLYAVSPHSSNLESAVGASVALWTLLCFGRFGLASITPKTRHGGRRQSRQALIWLTATEHPGSEAKLIRNHMSLPRACRTPGHLRTLCSLMARMLVNLLTLTQLNWSTVCALGIGPRTMRHMWISNTPAACLKVPRKKMGFDRYKFALQMGTRNATTELIPRGWL